MPTDPTRPTTIVVPAQAETAALSASNIAVDQPPSAYAAGRMRVQGVPCYLGFVSRIPFSAPVPICDSPRVVPRTPSAGFVSYLRPTTQTRDRETTSKLAPLSEAHSIDAIPSCTHFTAYRLPKLHRVAPGTGEGEKRVPTIQIKSNLRRCPAGRVQGMPCYWSGRGGCHHLLVSLTRRWVTHFTQS